MHSIRVHELMTRLISIFYRIGLWHRGDKPTVKEIWTKCFYYIYYTLFLVSIVAGSIKTGKLYEKIFLAQMSIGVAAVSVKLWFLLWNQSQICHLANRVCVFSIRDDDDHVVYENRIEGFAKCVLFYQITTIVGSVLSSLVLSLFGSEKTLFFDIGFPLDWKNSDIAFWMATVFIFTEMVLTTIAISFSVIFWYLLFISSLRYEVLASELSKMGRIGDETEGKASVKQTHHSFLKEFKELIECVTHLRKSVTILDWRQCLANEFKKFPD